MDFKYSWWLFRSCFPQTIINRVLLCGLTDFHAYSSSETSASIADSDLQKMPSVAGILSHLATQHGESVRQAMWTVVKVILSIACQFYLEMK